MRITNNMATQLAVAQFAVARERMEEAQSKVTSGKRFTKASEDPTAANTVMANSGALRALEQYKRNIGTANRRLSLEETAVDQLNSILTRAKELAIGQGSDTASTATRAAALAEVNQLLQQAASLANTKDGGEYLFGGLASATAPVSVDLSGAVATFTASGSVGTRQVEIASGQRARTAHDATQVFGDGTSGALKALQDLATAMNTGSGTAIRGAIGAFDTVIANTQTILSEVGARGNQMQIAESNISAFNQTLVTLNSDLQDVDLENAMVDLVSRQTAYQAAMAATSRVMNLNLTDYLR